MRIPKPERKRLHTYLLKVRDADHVEIPLKQTVLSRSSMYGDISIVKPYSFAIEIKAEIVLIQWNLSLLRYSYRPAITFDQNKKGGERLASQPGQNAGSTFERNRMFARITACNDSHNWFFHHSVYLICRGKYCTICVRISRIGSDIVLSCRYAGDKRTPTLKQSGKIGRYIGVELHLHSRDRMAKA